MFAGLVALPPCQSGKRQEIQMAEEKKTPEEQLREATWAWVQRAVLTAVLIGSGFVMARFYYCLLYTSPSPRDKRQSRMPSSA